MIRILPTLFILTFGVPAAALADQKDTIRDMARFDRAFIPAFFVTWEGDGAGAYDAVAQLEEAWETLKRKYFDGLSCVGCGPRRPQKTRANQWQNGKADKHEG